MQLVGGVGPVALAGRQAELDMARLHRRRHQIAETRIVRLLLSGRGADCSRKGQGDEREERMKTSLHGFSFPLGRAQLIAATTVAPRAPRTTTSQGGTAHSASNRKATIPIAKSAGAKIALVY